MQTTFDDSEPERRSSDEHTRQIVHFTINDIFDRVGVDMVTAEGRAKFRENMEFLSDARAGTALVKRTFWGGVVLGIMGTLYKFGAAILLWMQKP